MERKSSTQFRYRVIPEEGLIALRKEMSLSSRISVSDYDQGSKFSMSM